MGSEMCIRDRPDIEAGDELFTILMGEDVPDRRAFIEQNASEVTSLDV